MMAVRPARFLGQVVCSAADAVRALRVDDDDEPTTSGLTQACARKGVTRRRRRVASARRVARR